MANALNIQSFDQKDALISAVASSILEESKQAFQQNGDVRILLSGGSTPGPIYKKLDADLALIGTVHLGLVDERYVPFESEFSNERLISNCFTKLLTHSGTLRGMVYDLNDETENIDVVAREYQLFAERTDVILLGMGDDGHFASIFPNDPESKLAMQNFEKPIRATRAPNFPNQRITWDLSSICKAKSAYLVITGEKKLNLLENSVLNLPIHQLINVIPEIKIYYSK